MITICINETISFLEAVARRCRKGVFAKLRKIQWKAPVTEPLFQKGGTRDKMQFY